MRKSRARSVFAVQKIRSILNNGIEQNADIPVRQQHTNGDGRHAVRHLALGSNADWPPGFTKRSLWPTEFDVHDVTAVGVDRTDRFNPLPRDVLRHQSLRECRAGQPKARARNGAAAETAHWKQRPPATSRKATSRTNRSQGSPPSRRCGGEKDKAGDGDLAEAPGEGDSLWSANFLRFFNMMARAPRALGARSAKLPPGRIPLHSPGPHSRKEVAPSHVPACTSDTRLRGDCNGAKTQRRE